MQKSNINRILKKEGWTGAEVGKILLQFLAEHVECMRGERERTTLSETDFKNILHSLKSQHQIDIYCFYSSLYEALVNSTNLSSGKYQQFYNGYYRYSTAISHVVAEENEREHLEYKPLTYTKEGYDKLQAEYKDWVQTQADSYLEAMYWLIKNPHTLPEDIQAIFNATDKEKATNPRILLNIVTDAELGYWVDTESDKSSGECTQEEWAEHVQAVIKEHKKELLIKKLGASTVFYALTHDTIDYTDTPEDIVSFIEALSPEERNAVIQLWDDAVYDEDIACIGVNYADRPFNLAQPDCIKWVDLEEPPEELTKRDVLYLDAGRYFDRWSDATNAEGGYEQNIPLKAQFIEFTEDYPELYKALDKYLRDSVPAFKDVTLDTLDTTTASIEALASGGLKYYASILEPSVDNIEDYLRYNKLSHSETLRLNRSGIAVVLSENVTPATDEEGRVKDKLTTSFTRLIDENFNITDDDNFNATLLEPALQYLYAHNALVDLIADVYSLDVIRTCKEDMTDIEEDIHTVNNLVYEIYYSNYGTDEEKAQRRNNIDRCFKPIILEDFKPKQDRLDKVRAILMNSPINRDTGKMLDPAGFNKLMLYLFGEEVL